MKTPPFKEEKYFEHPRYAEFLVSMHPNALDTFMDNVDPGFKQNQFSKWLRAEEAAEDAADFKNLVPMNIRMNTEEWNWFTARLAEEYTEQLPNLRALVKHPPKAFKDME